MKARGRERERDFGELFSFVIPHNPVQHDRVGLKPVGFDRPRERERESEREREREAEGEGEGEVVVP